MNGPFDPAWSPDGGEVAFSRYDLSNPCQPPNFPMRLYVVVAAAVAACVN